MTGKTYHTTGYLISAFVNFHIKRLRSPPEIIFVAVTSHISVHDDFKTDHNNIGTPHKYLAIFMAHTLSIPGEYYSQYTM